MVVEKDSPRGPAERNFLAEAPMSSAPLLLCLGLTIGQLPGDAAPARPPVIVEGNAAGKRDVVLQWNEVALQAIRADKTPPPLAARNLAIVHLAIYDAVNSI